MLAGMGAGKAKIFDENGRKALSRFVFYIATSALIIDAVLSLSRSELSKLPNFIVVNCIIYVVVFFVLYLTLRFLKIPYKTGASILYAGTTANTVYLGLPVIRALYGAEGILFAVALLTIPSIVADILDFYFLNSWRAGKASFSKVLKDFILNPLVLSSLVGFLLLIIGISLPETLRSSLRLLGSGATGLALFAMGLFLSESSWKNFSIKLPLVTTIIKLLVVPFISYIIGYLCGLSGLALSVTVIMAALPSAIFCMVVATEYEFDERGTADTILVSSLFFLLTSGLWVSLVG